MSEKSFLINLVTSGFLQKFSISSIPEFTILILLSEVRATWGTQVTQQPPGTRSAEHRSGIVGPVSGRLQLCHLAVREISAVPLATNQVLQAAILSCVPASQLRGPVKHWSQPISPPWNEGVPTASLRPQQSRGYHPFFLVSRLLVQPCHCSWDTSMGPLPGPMESSRREVGRIIATAPTLWSHRTLHTFQ